MKRSWKKILIIVAGGLAALILILGVAAVFIARSQWFREFVREKLESTPQEQIRPGPLVTGDDLIAAGYTPGPQFKEILAAVEDAQLEGAVASKEEALKFVREQFRLTSG